MTDNYTGPGSAHQTMRCGILGRFGMRCTTNPQHTLSHGRCQRHPSTGDLSRYHLSRRSKTPRGSPRWFRGRPRTCPTLRRSGMPLRNCGRRSRQLSNQSRSLLHNHKGETGTEPLSPLASNTLQSRTRMRRGLSRMSHQKSHPHHLPKALNQDHPAIPHISPSTIKQIRQTMSCWKRSSSRPSKR